MKDAAESSARRWRVLPPDKNNPREAEPGLAAPRHEGWHRGDGAGHWGRVLHPQPPSLLPYLALKSSLLAPAPHRGSLLPACGGHAPPLCAPMHGAGLRGGTMGPRHLPTSPGGLSVPRFPRGFGVRLESGWERGPASPGAPAAPDPCCRGQAARGFLPRFLPLTARSLRCLARAPPAAPPAGAPSLWGHRLASILLRPPRGARCLPTCAHHVGLSPPHFPFPLSPKLSSPGFSGGVFVGPTGTPLWGGGRGGG